MRPVERMAKAIAALQVTGATRDAMVDPTHQKAILMPWNDELGAAVELLADISGDEAGVFRPRVAKAKAGLITVADLDVVNLHAAELISALGAEAGKAGEFK